MFRLSIMPPRRSAPKRRRPAPKAKAVAKLSKPMKRAIKQVVRGEAETKRTAFYCSFNDGTSTARSDGLFSKRGWALQNNVIGSNNTDILQLIPFVTQGTDDWQRIGQRIRPSSLSLRGSVRCDLSGTLIKLNPSDFKVYIYVLQHVSLKDYTNLYANNNFTQLLETGEGTTVPFTGIPQNNGMPVAKQYYHVLQRKQITLRYGGAYMNPNAGTGIPPTDAVACVANSHTWYADYSLNLTKHLPKVLMYPEDATSPSPGPAVLNAPTNSSIFMAMGFIDWFNPSDSTTTLTLPRLEQTYVTQLSFKDM